MGVRNRWETLLICSCCPLCKLRRVIESLRKNKSHHRVDSGFAGMLTGFFFLFWRSWSFIAICGLRADRRIKNLRSSPTGSPTSHWPMPFIPSSYILFLLVFFSLRRFFFCFFFIPVGTEWFHPHRLSVTKDWPEYKNIISFLKRRTQTWFNGKKNNPSMFRESLG